MDWKDIIIILISVVFGYIINLTTPFLKSYVDKGSLSLRNRRIEAIKEEYSRYKQYRENNATLTVEILRQLIKSLFFAAIFLLFTAVELFEKLDGKTTWIIENIGIFLGALLGVFTSMLTDTTRLIDTIANFEKYKQNAMKKLEKLGATLEEEENKKPVRKK